MRRIDESVGGPGVQRVSRGRELTVGSSAHRVGAQDRAGMLPARQLPLAFGRDQFRDWRLSESGAIGHLQ